MCENTDSFQVKTPQGAKHAQMQTIPILLHGGQVFRCRITLGKRVEVHELRGQPSTTSGQSHQRQGRQDFSVRGH